MSPTRGRAELLHHKGVSRELALRGSLLNNRQAGSPQGHDEGCPHLRVGGGPFLSTPYTFGKEGQGGI